jgi:hypothetical protein
LLSTGFEISFADSGASHLSFESVPWENNCVWIKKINIKLARIIIDVFFTFIVLWIKIILNFKLLSMDVVFPYIKNHNVYFRSKAVKFNILRFNFLYL